jgi:hypothetical protein
MIKVLAVLSFLLLSCMGCRTSNDTDIQDNNLLTTEKIRYTKDFRTGLCYAYTGSISYGACVVYSITCVPCSSAENLIKK